MVHGNMVYKRKNSLRHYADELKKVCKQAKERCYIIMYSTGKGNVLRKQCQEIRREIKENMKCTGIKKGSSVKCIDRKKIFIL